MFGVRLQLDELSENGMKNRKSTANATPLCLYYMPLKESTFSQLSILCHSLQIDILVWKVSLIRMYVVHSMICSAIQLLNHPMELESRRLKLIGFGAPECSAQRAI
jgi:hypothetical protein